MGAVYLVKHRQIQAEAAVKVLNHFYSHRPEIVARFQQEALAANVIENQGIVRIFDCGQLASGEPYFLMEYIKGKTLRDWLLDREDLGSEPQDREFLYVAQQIASIMAAAHNREVIHRDLKPDNIMVIEDEFTPGGSRVKVLDFGIAKVVSQASAAGDEIDAFGHRVYTGPIVTGGTAPGGFGVVPTGSLERTQAGNAPPAGADEDRELSGGEPDLVAPFPPPVTVLSPAPPPVAMLSHAPRAGTRPEPPSSVSVAAVSGEPRGSGARWSSAIAFKTSPNLVGMGTKGYAAPEQMRAPKDVEKRSDVYSLGVIVFEALKGRQPHAGEDVLAGEEGALAALVKKMLANDPTARPMMTDVAECLRKLIGRNPELDRAFEIWMASAKSDALLPKGRALFQMRAWAEGRRDLVPDEQEFLRRAGRRQDNRERLFRGAGIASIVLLLCTLLFSFWWYRKTDQQIAQALAKELRAQDLERQATGAAKNAEDANKELIKARDTALAQGKSAQEAAYRALQEVVDATGKANEFKNLLAAVKREKDKADAAAEDAEKKRIAADEAREQAERERNAADVAARDALAAKKIAEEAATSAVAAKNLAERTAREAERRAKDADAAREAAERQAREAVAARALAEGKARRADEARAGAEREARDAVMAKEDAEARLKKFLEEKPTLPDSQRPGAASDAANNDGNNKDGAGQRPEPPPGASPSPAPPAPDPPPNTPAR